MNNLVQQKETLCTLVLACDASDDENSLACSELEVHLENIADTELDGEETKNKARVQFPCLGKPGNKFSVTKSFQEKRMAKKAKKALPEKARGQA